jgi:CRISPR-associated protein Cmr4
MEPQGGSTVSAWEKAVICGIYTISPLHVSTGQAEGAIDLPVAKEPHTGYPVIPASSLKGVARDAFEGAHKGDVDELFGPQPKRKKADEQTQEGAPEGEAARSSAKPALFAGALVFTEARLVAYAARSLNRPFLYVTSRLILERLHRDLRAAGIKGFDAPPLQPDGAVLVADAPLAKSTLVLEDLVYAGDITESKELARIGKALGRLLPASEADTQRRLEKSLIVIPDDDFGSLVRRLPVRARIKLDENKTTSGDDGSLWYEEQVPSDCLFVSMIGARRGKLGALRTLQSKREALEVSQIGGNETVGEGICFWTVVHETGEKTS